MDEVQVQTLHLHVPEIKRYSKMTKRIVLNTYLGIQCNTTSKCNINLRKCAANYLKHTFFSHHCITLFFSSCNFSFLRSMWSISPSQQVCPNTFGRILKDYRIHNIWYFCSYCSAYFKLHSRVAVRNLI